MNITKEQLNFVPKDTVDNIMKTYENIINQHMERMEQISESIKDLSNIINTSDKEGIQCINEKCSEIKKKIDETIEENKVILSELISKLTGPQPEYNTNLKAIHDDIKNNTKTLNENTSLLKGLKNKLSYYIAILSAIVGIVSFVYVFIQKANTTMLNTSMQKIVTEIVETKNSIDNEFKYLDINKDGIISPEEFKNKNINKDRRNN